MITVAVASGDPRREHETAIALRDRLLKQALGLSDPSSCVIRLPSGRPALDRPVYDLSVSHSAGRVAVGLLTPGAVSIPAGSAVSALWTLEETADAIGLDLECVAGKTEERCRRIAGRFFSPVEQERIDRSDRPVETFLTLWTQKESAVKATGEGLRALRSVDLLAPCPDRRFFTRTVSLQGEAFVISVCLLKNAGVK